MGTTRRLYDRHTPVEEFLGAAGARQAIPGGGAVAALVGALAASMGEMVLNYSLGKKDLEIYESELRPALAQFNAAHGTLLALMEEDQAAYLAMSAARKLAKDDPARPAAVAEALAAAIRVPQETAATAVEVLELTDQMVNFVNPMLLSDLAVCADMAMCAARCGVYNVRVNTRDLTDPAERTRIEATVSQLLSRAAAVIQRVSPRIWGRLEEA